MKRIYIMVVVMVIAAQAWAKPARELEAALRQAFTPADYSLGFLNAQYPFLLDRAHGFAVIKKMGIPAAPAEMFITPQEYAYFPFLIEVDRTWKKYPKKKSTDLDPGTIMVVTGLDVVKKTIEMKLLGIDIPSEDNVSNTRNKERMSVLLVFQFPQLQMNAADAPVILAQMKDYATPAATLAEAQQISAQMKRGQGPAGSSEVHIGMSMDDVRQLKGVPNHITTYGDTVIYSYGHHTVVFVGGKVHDITWK